VHTKNDPTGVAVVEVVTFVHVYEIGATEEVVVIDIFKQTVKQLRVYPILEETDIVGITVEPITETVLEVAQPLLPFTKTTL